MLAEIALSVLSIIPACNHKHGRQYVICAETGNNPNKYANGKPHPGPSSASGLYGLLSSTRRVYGTADNYMLKRYGSWSKAEMFHRHHNWW